MTKIRSAAALGTLALVPAAAAFPTGFNGWLQKYPTSTLSSRMVTLTGSGCNVCHAPPERFFPGTCYREDLITAVATMGVTVVQAIDLIDQLDSDGDGVPNGVEIRAARLDQPGQVGYHPGLRGPTGVDLCGGFPENPVTSQLETPPNYCYANCDESSNAPTLNALDFSCFLQKFTQARALDPFLQDKAYANCDGSTSAPVLNALDFGCFLQRYQQGCK